MIIGYGGDCPKCKGLGTVVFRSGQRTYIGVCSLCCGTTWTSAAGTCRDTLPRAPIDTEPTYAIDTVKQLRLPE